MKPPIGAGLPFPISQRVEMPETARADDSTLPPGEMLAEHLRPGDTVRAGGVTFSVHRVEIADSVRVSDSDGVYWTFMRGQILRAWSPLATPEIRG